MVKILKAMANERRILILRHISKMKESTVGQISDVLDLSFRSVSKHLSVLYGADLIKFRQSGLNRYYSINNNKFPRELSNLIKM